MEVSALCVDTCYVYAKIPPSDAAGYRANAWDVENWTQEVRLKVVTRDDKLTVKLFDKDSGELFAECPVPNDLPVQTAVEPVLDSSRYYVIKIVDSQSGQHAFIGIGFRERERSADFMTAIADHRQYLQRKKLAAEMRLAASEGVPAVDYSLKPGEKITIRLPTRQKETAARTNASAGQSKSPDKEEWSDFVGT